MLDHGGRKVRDVTRFFGETRDLEMYVQDVYSADPTKQRPSRAPGPAATHANKRMTAGQYGLPVVQTHRREAKTCAAGCGPRRGSRGGRASCRQRLGS